MTHVTDFAYLLEEYEVPSLPYLMIMRAWLSVNIERVNGDLEYRIDAVELEKPDGTTECFKKDSFIYDILVFHIYEDKTISASIMDAAREHI